MAYDSARYRAWRRTYAQRWPQTTLRAHPDVLRRLRAWCTTQGVTQQAWLEGILREALDRAGAPEV